MSTLGFLHLEGPVAWGTLRWESCIGGAGGLGSCTLGFLYVELFNPYFDRVHSRVGLGSATLGFLALEEPAAWGALRWDFCIGGAGGLGSCTLGCLHLDL